MSTVFSRALIHPASREWEVKNIRIFVQEHLCSSYQAAVVDQIRFVAAYDSNGSLPVGWVSSIPVSMRGGGSNCSIPLSLRGWLSAAVLYGLSKYLRQ